jgi:predicted PurR-regulated permease PerM
MDKHRLDYPTLSGRTKLLILIVIGLLAILLIWEARAILAPFLWALLASYLLAPVVNYFNVRGGMPRLWSVVLLYAIAILAVVAASHYLYPSLVQQGSVFLEDIPRLEASLINLVGPRPLGIDIASLVDQTVKNIQGYGNANSAGRLLVNAAETAIRLFLFLVATFYLLMDAPRLRRSIRNTIPEAHRPELLALARQINLTWQQYIRGELVLFALMATATSIGLTILGVPGAIFLGLASGLLELLPLIGPITAGALAVSVAYFSGANPFNWNQIAYAGVVALMYFIFRQLEDYLVIPNVLGRAVRLHPLVVLFSLAAGGIIGGLYGLIVAVPIAAMLRAILTYLYGKLLDLPTEFEPVPTIGGGVIEIPIHAHVGRASEGPAAEGSGTT